MNGVKTSSSNYINKISRLYRRYFTGNTDNKFLIRYREIRNASALLSSGLYFFLILTSKVAKNPPTLIGLALLIAAICVFFNALSGIHFSTESVKHGYEDICDRCVNLFFALALFFAVVLILPLLQFLL